jgi:hypothetical protein
VTGGEGDDVLDGSGGNDTAVFSGNRSDYVASHGSASAIIITDQRSGTTDGEDTTSSFELFKFADRTYTAAELFAPTLTGVAASITLPENSINAAAAILDSSVTVSTVESINGGTLAVSGLLTQDIVSVQDVGSQSGQIGFAGGNVSYGGVVIGTATGGSGTTLTITFNASATDAAVQELVEHLAYQTTSDQPTASRNLTITLTDGAAGSASSVITVNITSENDAPSITSNGGGATATVSPQENGTAVTTVTASDPDLSPTLTYSIVGGDDQAKFQIDASTGALSFIAAPNYEAPTDSDTDNSYIVEVQASDGVLTADQTITVNVTDANETPSITSDGGGPTATVSTQENDTAVTTVTATDPDASTTFVYSIVGGADQARFQIDASTGALSFIAAPDYETPTDSGTDNGYVVQVQASDGSLTGIQTITVDVTDENELQVGTPGDDAFVATTGAYRIDALGGVDTVTFSFALTDATFEWDGNAVIVSAAGSEITMTGMEVFVFTDGTVDNADGNVLVDDLFYYANNHDVWLAQVDADLHYSEMGWTEDRDPNAFFDVSVYLALNQGVKAAGIDPLTGYAQTGWMEGRIPSLSFDPQQYLADNPDVAAAHIDPLQHFLQVGASEGRQPTAVARLVNADGFDAAYYLRNNADVADAGIDPYAHFQQIGWREGRNPNAFFDTAGYLAQNPDVAAADLNPLYHYDNWGWHEGRDPATGFDSVAYLAANADVADANINPLLHFLQSGIAEGRLPLGDGLWS